MNNEISTTATHRTDPATAGLLTIIGINDGVDRAEWGRIRASQIDAVRHLAIFLLAANLAAIGATAMLVDGFVAPWVLSVWCVCTAAIALCVTLSRLAGPPSGKGTADVREIRATAIEGILLAIAWSAVPVLFCTHAPGGTTSGLGVILAVLMTAAAITMAPLALATLLFLGALGFATSAQLVVSGAYGAALGTASFTAMLCMVCIGRVRSLAVIRSSQITLDERDQTVSLLLREFEDSAADWLWETDSARRIVRASPRFALACGLDPASIDGMPFLRVLAGPSWETGNFAAGLRTLAEKLKAREAFRDIRLPVAVGGEERWWEIAASPRFDDRGIFCGFRGVGSDVTEQRASADKINRMARFDTLTGLPNRLMVNETLVRAMGEAEKWRGRCAFMMIDLDRFKAVNDTLGHPIGDRLLSRVSERLGQLMTKNEMCGRLGGDEFAVIVRDASDSAALEAFAHRIIDTLSRPYEVDHHTLFIGASIGVAIGPRDGRTAEMLIRSADLALYRSKDAGGGVFHAYDPQLHVQAEERRVLEMALRGALEKREMHLVYQPVVDAQTTRLIGFEALLRWQNPQFGDVPPAKFIPLAEEARLIGPIGEWVLRTACEEAARWPGTIRVAVNVSGEQVASPQFMALVTSALAATGLAPGRLELEVTESVFLDEGRGATRMLDGIADLGVLLSLDDFGTGYSSLGYLSRTRFSSIKIDRSFVKAAALGTREAVAITHAVVALANSLGMATTAEGVESEEEYEMAKAFGCSNIQGFYFGRPLPVAEARLLAQRGWDDVAAA